MVGVCGAHGESSLAHHEALGMDPRDRASGSSGRTSPTSEIRYGSRGGSGGLGNHQRGSLVLPYLCRSPDSGGGVVDRSDRQEGKSSAT